MRKGDRDELARRPHPSRVAEHGLDEGPVVGVVEEAARVVEQLTQRDRVAVRNETGQVALDRIVDVQLPLGLELQHDGGDERLRDACDPPAVACAHRRARGDVGVARRAAARPP